MRLEKSSEKSSEKSNATRRSFFKWTAATALAATYTGGSGLVSQISQPVFAAERPGKKQPPFKLGLASYTLRKFPLDQALAITQQVGLDWICLKSFHLPLEASIDEIKQVRQKVADLGFTLYAGGVITMTTREQIEQAFSYAQAAGMQLIIGVPGPGLLDLVNEKVQQTRIGVAIHNHGPGDRLYPLPETAYQRIQNLDKRIGLCIDIGHTLRAGVDPSESAKKFADRLLDVHIKDITEPTAQGRPVEMGRGVIDIPRFLETLLEINYTGVVAFEHEKDPDSPQVGLAESVGYTRGVLDTLLRG